MKEIVDWLLSMEQLAHEVYKAASDHFMQDKQFSSFLATLAEEESLHFQLIRNAADSLKEKEELLVAAIDMDSNTKELLEAPLRDLHNLIKSRSVTCEVAIEFILKVEFSEFNHVFLYVMDAFQKGTRRCQQVAATIQAHQKRIEEFLKDIPGGLKIWEDFQKLPRIWKQKILIVEDEAALRKMFERILRELGTVETATNGREALDKLKDHFFNIVISDIDMPVMSGLQFYQKAVEMDPDIGCRFLFCSGKITSDIECFFRARDLMFLEKPFKFRQFHAAVRDIMGKSH
jgi:CheY-like chemotaxis protein